jgi:glucose/arabinose dehydrogenase
MPLRFTAGRRAPPAPLVALAVLASLAAFAASAAAQVPVRRPGPPTAPRTVRLSAAEAVRLTAAVRRRASVQVAGGLEAAPWATERLLADPVALDVDGRGVVYVTSSSRSGGELDIRGHPDWVPAVHTLRTTEELRAFYRRELAPARSARNAWLPDRNKDRSRDWRDLTVLTERVQRLRDRAGRGVADESQVVFEGFNDDLASDVAGGLLARGGDLWVGAAPDVWRLRDTDGDGVIDEKASISHGYNVHPSFFGHGIAGLTMGPDGRVYWAVGDMGFDVTDKAGRRWSQPNRGGILRANPDGTDFEVFASGLRNPQAFAFDELGNLIAVDNDGDYPGETERVTYVTHGSDAGWRSTWQYGKYTDPANNRYNVWIDERMFVPRFPGQAAYITPPIVPAHAGPAGLVYNPGTALASGGAATSSCRASPARRRAPGSTRSVWRRTVPASRSSRRPPPSRGSSPSGCASAPTARCTSPTGSTAGRRRGRAASGR